MERIASAVSFRVWPGTVRLEKGGRRAPPPTDMRTVWHDEPHGVTMQKEHGCMNYWR